MVLCVSIGLVGPQTVFADPVFAGSQAPALLTPEERNEAANAVSLATQPVLGPSPSPFMWGDVILMPHFEYTLAYNNGIPDAPGHFTNTYLQTLAPGFLLDVGSHLSLEYTPVWNDYSSKKFYNFWGQDVNLAFTDSLWAWDFRFTQDFNSSANTLVETGLQTKQRAWSTLLSATHFFSQALYLELSGNQNFRFVTDYPDSLEWSTTAWFGYKFGLPVDIAAGCTEGFVILYGSPDMFYTRPKLRLKIQPTEKISITADGGYERREFLSGDLGALNSPIVDARLEYRPFDATLIDISAEREVTVSYFRGQLTKTARYSGMLQQRLLGRIYASATVGYNYSSYVGAAAGIVTGRSDYTNSFGGRLSTTFLQRGSIAVFIQHLSNSSNLPGFTYSTRQIGCEIAYRY